MKLKMLSFVGCIFIFFFHCASSEPLEFDNLPASGNKLKVGHLNHRMLHYLAKNPSHKYDGDVNDDIIYLPIGYTEFYGCDNTVTAYKFSETKETWQDARLACRQEGGYLGYPDCPAEGKTFYNILKHRNDGGAWIGIHDRPVEGNWVTLFNDEPDYVNWASSEPNDFGIKGENCAEIYHTDGKWYDSECSKKLLYVCKIDIEYGF